MTLKISQNEQPVSYQHVVERQLHRARPHAHAARRISLGIAVHEQRALLGRGQARGEVDRGGCLADAAFLVGDGVNAGRFRHPWGARRRGRGVASYTTEPRSSIPALGSNQLQAFSWPVTHSRIQRPTCRLM